MPDEELYGLSPNAYQHPYRWSIALNAGALNDEIPLPVKDATRPRSVHIAEHELVHALNAAHGMRFLTNNPAVAASIFVNATPTERRELGMGHQGDYLYLASRMPYEHVPLEARGALVQPLFRVAEELWKDPELGRLAYITSSPAELPTVLTEYARWDPEALVAFGRWTAEESGVPLEETWALQAMEDFWGVRLVDPAQLDQERVDTVYARLRALK